MPSKQIEFSELEKFTISQTPTILDALTSTYNRAADLLTPLREDLLSEFEKTAKKAGYALASGADHFSPFGLVPGQRVGKFQRLRPSFQYFGGIEVSRRKIYIGFDFGYYSEATPDSGYFYFAIWSTGEKPFKDDKFVESLAAAVAGFEVKPYPDTPPFFEIVCRTTEVSKVLETGNAYRDKVAIPLLRALR